MAGKKKAAPEVTENVELEAVEAGPEAAVAAPRFGKKQKIMAAAAAVLVLAGGGGAAAFLMGGSKEESAENRVVGEDGGGEAEAAAEEEGGEGGKKEGLPLIDVPPLLVNLRTPNGEPRYLKLRFMIEVTSSGKADQVQRRMPAIIDSYQPFLRELRPEDIAGSAAVYRIKEEMMVRTVAVVGKGIVKDILIQDLVQQ